MTRTIDYRYKSNANLDTLTDELGSSGHHIDQFVYNSTDSKWYAFYST